MESLIRLSRLILTHSFTSRFDVDGSNSSEFHPSSRTEAPHSRDRNSVHFSPNFFVETSSNTLSGSNVVVFLHGFPEIWYSWRYQMIVVAEAGFRAIAPDFRGYGLSDTPSEPSKVEFSDLVSDLLGILDALNIPKSPLVKDAEKVVGTLKEEVTNLKLGYRDYLQAPLQPLMDNLESQTYEIFEKDAVKYIQFLEESL